MQFIYDNITATIIATTVTMILITIQLRATQTNIAQTSRNVVKMEAQNFATWLEEDLEQMGENVDLEEEAPFQAPVDSSGITNTFVFYRDSLASGGSDTIRIATRYRVRKRGSTEVDGESKELFQLVRKRKVGGGAWADKEVKGSSMPALGYFNIDMLDPNANVVANPASNFDKVHSTRVRFSVVAPFQNRQTTLPVTHVGSVLLLQRGDETPGTGSIVNVPSKKSDCEDGGWNVLQEPDGTPFTDEGDCTSFVASL